MYQTNKRNVNEFWKNATEEGVGILVSRQIEASGNESITNGFKNCNCALRNR